MEEDVAEKTSVKVNLNTPVSSFSLSSIALKKAASQINKPKQVTTNQPEDSFEFETAESLWKTYTEKLKKEGKQNIASILAMHTIGLKKPNTITFIVANEMNKVEVTREMEYLLPFLRERLNNYYVKIELEISETTREDALYSASEKYHHLVKINPVLNELKEKFDLDF